MHVGAESVNSVDSAGEPDGVNKPGSAASAGSAVEMPKITTTESSQVSPSAAQLQQAMNQSGTASRFFHDAAAPSSFVTGIEKSQPAGCGHVNISPLFKSPLLTHLSFPLDVLKESHVGNCSLQLFIPPVFHHRDSKCRITPEMLHERGLPRAIAYWKRLHPLLLLRAVHFKLVSKTNPEVYIGLNSRDGIMMEIENQFSQSSDHDDSEETGRLDTIQECLLASRKVQARHINLGFSFMKGTLGCSLGRSGAATGAQWKHNLRQMFPLLFCRDLVQPVLEVELNPLESILVCTDGTHPVLANGEKIHIGDIKFKLVCDVLEVSTVDRRDLEALPSFEFPFAVDTLSLYDLPSLQKRSNPAPSKGVESGMASADVKQLTAEPVQAELDTPVIVELGFHPCLLEVTWAVRNKKHDVFDFSGPDNEDTFISASVQVNGHSLTDIQPASWFRSHTFQGEKKKPLIPIYRYAFASGLSALGTTPCVRLLVWRHPEMHDAWLIVKVKSVNVLTFSKQLDTSGKEGLNLVRKIGVAF